MSTNFYIRTNLPPWESRHLGQRSAGWKFLFRAYPTLGITHMQEWLAQLQDAERIWDEYSQPYSAAEMLQVIDACQDGKKRELYGHMWHDGDGNTFSAEEFS